MNKLLIDTNIYTLAMKGNQDVITELQLASEIGISSVSIGELISGFKGGSKEKKNREELHEFLDAPRTVVYSIDADTSEFYAEVVNSLRKIGRPIPTNDIWIASTALQHGLKLFTRDTHFSFVPGLLLL